MTLSQEKVSRDTASLKTMCSGHLTFTDNGAIARGYPKGVWQGNLPDGLLVASEVLGATI